MVGCPTCVVHRYSRSACSSRSSKACPSSCTYKHLGAPLYNNSEPPDALYLLHLSNSLPRLSSLGSCSLGRRFSLTADTVVEEDINRLLPARYSIKEHRLVTADAVSPERYVC